MGNQRALWMVGLEYLGECFFFGGGKVGIGGVSVKVAKDGVLVF